MRVFWSIVLMLLLAGAAAAFFTESPNSPRPSSPRAAEPQPPAPEPTPQPTTATRAPTEPPSPPTHTATTPPATLPTDIDFEKDLQTAIKKAVGEAAPPPAAVKGTPFELPATPEHPAEKLLAARATRDGGAITIDGRYKVTGSGTQDDPYVVPFELLMSAGDVYDPRKGLTKLPQRVTFLHNKHVTLTGYVAFPIASTDPTELLAMFNQWDGCCIGVPPTAYDAVETKLAAPATGADKLMTYGRVTGVLKVDPYVDAGWLLGLYTMEGAVLSPAPDAPVGSPAEPEPIDN